MKKVICKLLMKNNLFRFCTDDKSAEAQKTRRLPWLALNEVIISVKLCFILITY